MKKAIFLDRDGVLNDLVLNPATDEYEPPHFPEQLFIFPYVVESLQQLQEAGFELFLVSNQPDYAKGKMTLDNIYTVHTGFDRILTSRGIHFREYYYCYHHPDGIVPEYSFVCKCRKPKPYFLLKAANDFKINLSNSWMIGDRDVDIECGKAAGTRTIMIDYQHSHKSRGLSYPDYIFANIKDALSTILSGY